MAQIKSTVIHAYICERICCFLYSFYMDIQCTYVCTYTDCASNWPNVFEKKTSSGKSSFFFFIYIYICTLLYKLCNEFVHWLVVTVVSSVAFRSNNFCFFFVFFVIIYSIRMDLLLMDF